MATTKGTELVVSLPSDTVITVPGIVALLPVALDGGRLAVALPTGGTGLTNTELRASAVPVSGTVTTGGLSDAQLRAAAVPVSGTFFQTTQPVSAVSLPLPAGAATQATLALLATDSGLASVFARQSDGTAKTLLRGSAKGTTVAGDITSTPVDANTQAVDVAVKGTAAVSGTFWQATQPVSAASLPLPAGASTEATLALIKAKTDNLDVLLSTRAVTGLTDAQLRASAVPISAASLPLPAGAATEATLAAMSAKLPATLGQKAMAASEAVVIASDQSNLPVQIKDSARVRCLFIFRTVAPAIADTLLTLNKSLDSTETTGTTFAVTASKRLRITAVSFSLKSGAAVSAFATMTLRTLKGAVLIGSPGILILDLGNTAATIGAADKVTLAIPSGGLEFSGTDQIGISLSAQAITNIISITLVGYEYTP